jgi:hypothetical protein
MENNNSLQLEHLTNQSDSFGSAIGSVMLQSSRVIAVGTAVALGVIGLAVRTKSYEVLILLPYLMFVLFFHYINLHTSILEMGGYKRYLEEQINEIIGEKIHLWETELVPRRHFNIANQFLTGIFSIILIGSVLIGLYQSYSHKYSWVFFTSITADLILIIGLIFAVVHMKKAHRKTYEDAKQVNTSANKAN